jgi:uncharacterized protein DUF1573
MKKLFIPFFFLLLGISLSTNAQKPAEFKFQEGEVHDFGVIKRGPPAAYKFEFTNTGETPLIVQGVTPSCGCTNVDWSKNPVLPGQTGYISLSLKTEEQHGVFKKEVYIQSNAKVPNGEKRYTIYIKGNAVDDDPKKIN